MSLDVTGASNFYYYGKPAREIKNPAFPAGQKITSLLPATIVKTRVATIAIMTCLVARRISLTMWRWPVVILGITLAAYIAYKHLLRKDPLINAFYQIAGGKEFYDKLPEIQLDPNKKTYENFITTSWEELEHPVYRFTTPDSRKGMLVKGLSHSVEQQPTEQLLQISPTQTRATMIFVEKLGPYDTPRRISNLAEWVECILESLNYQLWENSFSRFLEFSSSNTTGRKESGICGAISTDMANEFIEQRGVVNLLGLVQK